MQAIRVHEYGGPEVMKLETLPTPQPGPGEALVRVEASGVNFIDIYQRSGQYQLPLPMTLGREGAGRVEAIGPGVDTVQVGDRVGWAMVGASYATESLVPADRLVPLPDSVSSELAAAVLLQGMTAHFLTRTAFPLKAGDTCLVQAAAGGVGLLLCQMARMAGARVIGTTSTEEKAALARDAGADEIIQYTRESFVEAVQRLTNGRGVDVVYDSVGKNTFQGSLDCLRRRGYLILLGQSSGPVEPLDPQVLNAKGSLFLTRPTLQHYVETREELLARAEDVLGWVAGGELKVRIDRTYPLERAADAHRALAGRETSGKVVLLIQ